MQRSLRVLIVLLIVSAAVYFYLSGTRRHKRDKEQYYQTQLCNDLGGVMEQRLLDRTRVDCLTDTYAIEVDFARKWAESAGQSLYYALMTGKKPAVGLIIRDSAKDERRMKRLEKLGERYHIKIFKIKRGA